MMNSLRVHNNIVESNFSRHADLYDRYALMQCFAAEELIGRLPSGGVRNILDIGCGTGNYTLLLRDKFRLASIKAIDISRDMIDIALRKPGAPGIEFTVADGEEFEPVERFDLITSNATFQWFNDLGSSLSKYRSALTEEGTVLFSSFGPLTFCELGESLKEVIGRDARISSEDFFGKPELALMMKDRFRDCLVDEILIKKRYGSLEELLRHIKYTGARGSRASGIPLWTRGMLHRVEEAYMANFGCIEASYHIFYCEGSR